MGKCNCCTCCAGCTAASLFMLAVLAIVGLIFMGAWNEGFKLHKARIETAVPGYCQVTPDPASQDAIDSEEAPKKCIYQDADADSDEDSDKWEKVKGSCKHTWGDDWKKQMEAGVADDKYLGFDTCKFERINSTVGFIWCPCFYEGTMGLHVTSEDDEINKMISSSESGCGVTRWNEGQWEQEEPPAKGGTEAEASFDSWTKKKGRGYQKGSGYHCMAIKGDGGNIKDEVMIGFEKSEYVKGMGDFIDLMGNISLGLIVFAVLLMLLSFLGFFFTWRKYSKGRFWGKDPSTVDVIA